MAQTMLPKEDVLNLSVSEVRMSVCLWPVLPWCVFEKACLAKSVSLSRHKHGGTNGKEYLGINVSHLSKFVWQPPDGKEN